MDIQNQAVDSVNSTPDSRSISSQAFSVTGSGTICLFIIALGALQGALIAYVNNFQYWWVGAVTGLFAAIWLLAIIVSIRCRLQVMTPAERHEYLELMAQVHGDSRQT